MLDASQNSIGEAAERHGGEEVVPVAGRGRYAEIFKENVGFVRCLRAKLYRLFVSLSIEAAVPDRWQSAPEIEGPKSAMPNTVTTKPTADAIAFEDGEAINMGEGFMLMQKDDRGVAQSVYVARADLERLLAA